MDTWREDLHPRDGDGRFRGPGGTLTREGHRAARAADVAAHARVRGSAPPAFNPDRGRDLLPDFDREFAEEDGFHDDVGWQPYDEHLAIVADKQGWGPPTVGSPSDVDAAVAAGWTEIHRGVGDFPGRNGYGGRPPIPARTAQEVVDDFRTGGNEGGYGLYGNGYYFSAHAGVADKFAGPDAWRADGVRTSGGATLRAAIHPGARLGDYDTLERELEDLPAEQWTGVAADIGRYAALRGYDGYVVRGQDDGSGGGTGDQYVILNRSVLLAENGGRR